MNWDWAAKIVELSASGNLPIALVTVVACGGSTPCALGSKIIVSKDGSFFGTIGGGHLEQLAIADAQRALETGESKLIRYPLGAKAGQCCGGVVDAFVEVIGLLPTVYIFGAGHVAQALSRVLVGTPFLVNVIDERGEWLERLPEGVRRHDPPWDEFVRRATWDPARTFVAIMTHRHDTDEEIVWALRDKPARYVGLIGSTTKWRRFRERLAMRGATEEQLQRVRTPIGLDIGGKSPQEVAVSIAAELLKVWHGK